MIFIIYSSNITIKMNSINSVDELYIDLSMDQNEFIIFHTISSLINVICEYFNIY